MLKSAPLLVGFFPKITMPRPEWLRVPSVQEICSVSNCISAGPPNWVEQWQHNSLGFYDSEEIALALVADEPEHRYDLYAYELFLVAANAGKLEDFEIDIAIGQVPSDYEFLGYDVATKSVSAFFECSPLSCNGAAADFGTNRYCLLDGQSQADAALLQMSIVKYEPGLCYLFRVHRQKIMNHG
jgi:hypothetical protein